MGGRVKREEKITKKRRKGEPDPTLSREAIVQTALAIIDEDGLEAFSLRTLASRLGVYPTAIYWYVPNRNELLAQVVTHILSAEAPVRKRRTWQQSLRELFHQFRAAVRAHPNAAPLIGTQIVSNTNMDAAFVEHILAVLARSGLSGSALVAAYNSTIAAIVGFVAQEFAPMPRDDPASWQIAVQERMLAIDRNAYPTLSSHLGLLSNRAFILRWQNGVEAPLDDSYDWHIDLFVAGIEVMARRAAPVET